MKLSSYAFSEYGSDAKLYNGIHELELTIGRLRQRLFGNGHVEAKTVAGIRFGTDHSTACSIWGDDGQGGTVENFKEPLPCNCGALINWERAQLATATERATKAEAGLSLAVRALDLAALRKDWETGGYECSFEKLCEWAFQGRNWCKWPDDVSGSYPPDETDVLIYECGYLPGDPLFWESVKVGSISHSRGTMGPSHAKAWKLIDRPTLLDLEMTAIAQVGTEVNGLASDTFASGTDWRGNE